MRYLLSARVQPEKKAELLAAIESGSFGRGFPYGDLGEMLCEGRVDHGGTIRWVEVCYCREYYGVAMAEELPYFEEFLTDMTIADARAPAHCEGYPVCNDCDCTRKVRPKGEPFLEYLRRTSSEPDPTSETRPPRWLGWRGQLTEPEQRRNRASG
jgi:hypothetical protein